MGLMSQFCRRSPLLLLIAFCVAVYKYYNSEILTDLKRASAVTSRTPTVHHHHQRQQQQQHQQQRGAMVSVQANGNFTQRVTAFNAFLSSLRAEELKRRGAAGWRRPMSSPLAVVWGARDDYLQQLAQYNSVTTVVLPWLTSSPGTAWSSLHDSSNLLIQAYHEWTADNTLCSWIETPRKIKMRYDIIYNRMCNRNVNDTVRPSSLPPVVLNAKAVWRDQYWPNNGDSYPAHFYTDTPPYVFHMHIHRDAIITELGDVISDRVKLVLYACSHDSTPSIPSNLDNIPLHKEVFVVTQYWGTAVYHRMAEIVPRMALFVDFLKANPEIRILGPEVGGRLAELVEIIGLNKSRLVTGAARAEIVYQPRSTVCGFANVPESQMLSRFYRDYIRRTFPAQPRDRLILIRRSGSRRFTEQTAIEEAVKRAAGEYNLRYTLFADNPTPSLNDTMMMFHSAVVVVGPCGAGLTNILFSPPGTYIVEGVCNLPHVNLCLQRLALVLGHHWHGVTSRRGCEGVIDVPASAVDGYLRQYLDLWKYNR